MTMNRGKTTAPFFPSSYFAASVLGYGLNMVRVFSPRRLCSTGSHRWRPMWNTPTGREASADRAHKRPSQSSRQFVKNVSER